MKEQLMWGMGPKSKLPSETSGVTDSSNQVDGLQDKVTLRPEPSVYFSLCVCSSCIRVGTAINLIRL